jgi:hypothetical protein
MSHPGEGNPPVGGTDGTPEDHVDEAVMDLLHEHVPLTLLVDLVDAPPSEQVLVEEGLPPEQWWGPEAER